MFSSVRKFFFLVILLGLLFLAPKLAFAQTVNNSTSYSNQSTQSTAMVQHDKVQQLMIDVLSAFSCQLAGYDAAFPNQPCVTTNTKTNTYGTSNVKNFGLIGLEVQGMLLTFTPVAHTGTYIQDMTSNFGLVKHADAATDPCATGGTFGQGVGYCQLYPLLQIWSVMRNLAYLGFVFVFILIGFAIMLRLKLNPNTVVSIQNTIPKIIIALVLITFSYAIAGFLVDMMYVSIGVVIKLGTQVDPLSTNNANVTIPSIMGDLQGDNPISYANQMMGLYGTSNTAAQALGNAAGDIIASFGDAGRIMAALVGGIVGAKAGAAAGGFLQIAGSVIGGVAGTFVEPGGGSAAGAALGGGLATALGTALGFVAGAVAPGQTIAFMGEIIGTIVLFIAIFISLAQLWLVLLKAYITILIDVVFAPFWILLAIVPKSKFTFGSWVKDMLANLAVFPMVIGIFEIGKIFIDAFRQHYDSGRLFAPPLVGLNTGGEGATALQAVIGLGFIFLAPSALGLARSIFGAPKSSLIQNSIQGLQLGASRAGALWGQTGGRLVGVDKNGNPKPFTSILAERKREAAEVRNERYAQLQHLASKPGEKLSLGQKLQMGYYQKRQGFASKFSEPFKTSQRMLKFNDTVLSIIHDIEHDPKLGREALNRGDAFETLIIPRITAKLRHETNNSRLELDDRAILQAARVSMTEKGQPMRQDQINVLKKRIESKIEARDHKGANVEIDLTQADSNFTPQPVSPGQPKP